MKVLFLCGMFLAEHESEVIAQAKHGVEFSANIFQQRLYRGLLDCDCDVSVLSAPFIGSYPITSKTFRFRKFSTDISDFNTVPFLNVWGIRNISRSVSLKRSIRSFIQQDDEDKRIIVYSPHTPFLEAAVYAKRCDPRIKIVLVVPDLPQFMNLNEKQSWIYKFAKKWDIRKFNKLNRYVDSYVLLTEHMRNMIDIRDCPYTIVEGIVDSRDLIGRDRDRCTDIISKDKDAKYIVYTGKLNARFGVKDLIDAFTLLKGSEYRLVLCGAGDCEDYIREIQCSDPRILFMGQVTPAHATEWVRGANLLVNPRKNVEEYTKYSFPSKTIEYLLSGNAVAGYYLDGMPEIYRNFIRVPTDGSVSALRDALKSCSSCNGNTEYRDFIEYASRNLSCESVARRILGL